MIRSIPAIAVAVALVACVGQTPSAAMELPGTSWRVEDLDGKGVIDDAQSTIAFATDGRASGSTACNRWSATAEIGAGSLSFGPAIATRMACPEAMMDQEQRFLGVIEATRGWAIDGPYLRLRDGAGRDIARLIRE